MRAPEGPKDSSPGQAQRSPGSDKQPPRALEGRKTRSNSRSSPLSFYRPCRGSILFNSPTPGCAALARGYYLWPLRGLGFSDLRGPSSFQFCLSLNTAELRQVSLPEAVVFLKRNRNDGIAVIPVRRRRGHPPGSGVNAVGPAFERMNPAGFLCWKTNSSEGLPDRFR